MNSTEFSKAVFLMSQTVCAMAEIEGMKAKNKERTSLGIDAAYQEHDFYNIPNNYGINHNTALIGLQ